MLCLLEIILTVVAVIVLHRHKKGWGWGLIPLIVVLTVGFLMGGVIGAQSAGNINQAMQGVNSVFPVAIVLDVLAVIALIFLIVWGSRSKAA